MGKLEKYEYHNHHRNIDFKGFKCSKCGQTFDTDFQMRYCSFCGEKFENKQ